MSDSQTTRNNTAVDIVIRPARLSDLEEIIDVWLQGIVAATGHCLPGNEIECVSETFRQRLESQDSTFGVWVAIGPDNRVLGWQSLQPFGAHPIRRQLEAESSTYIRPGVRSGRLGLRLLLHAMQCAHESSLHLIMGYILATNSPAIRMAIAAGWQRIGVLPHLPREAETPPFEVWVYPIPK